MKGVWTHFVVPITAYESTPALSTQPAVPEDVKTLAYASKLQLADPKTQPQEDIPVEILIGGDHYWKVVRDNHPHTHFNVGTVISYHVRLDTKRN